MPRRHLRAITAREVGLPALWIEGHLFTLGIGMADPLGRIQPSDVGKHLYFVNGVIEVQPAHGSKPR